MNDEEEGGGGREEGGGRREEGGGKALLTGWRACVVKALREPSVLFKAARLLRGGCGWGGCEGATGGGCAHKASPPFNLSAALRSCAPLALAAFRPCAPTHSYRLGLLSAPETGPSFRPPPSLSNPGP